MESPTIIIDSREQIPYVFQGVETVRRALPAGDYSVLGYEDVIAVERKSLDDFVKTVVKDRSRFKAELIKLGEYRYACVVIEGNLSDLLSGNYRSGAHPASVFGALISIIVNSRIPVFPCSNRQIARAFTEHFLFAAARRFHGTESDRSEKDSNEGKRTRCDRNGQQ